ncbi:hypothetical protein BG015_011225 [Linnemannia schmuckeri]|uniref:RGS domain-containing protein n=1 Tax=Linnemannia schmuckeri TaxID=64567 RepID=A0A9P5V8C2_9FUNG|nr:hypothetical protein BG015_011225 [Linnemannia schmuckeri]
MTSVERQRAVEYLNFWTDVTAHEQLCRAFDVSERRFKRELQLEDRAFARDRRRQTRDALLENGCFSPDPGTGRAGVLGEGQLTDAQGLNSSNLYITSRSSLQLPLNDHLSFPLESRRYGFQDSAPLFPPMPPSLAQRRGSEQRPMGAYNRLLAGAGGRRTSLEKSRFSLDESPIPEQEGDDSSASTPSVPRSRIRRSVDAVGNSRLLGRRPSATEDHVHHHRLSERPAVSSPLNPTRPALPEHAVQTEMDQLAQAVEDSIQFSLGQAQTEITPMPQASVQSLRIVEPILEKKPSVANFEGGYGPLLPPLTIRRSGESAYAPSHYSTVHDGRAMLAQSYRTISVEDLEESVARIYRKYLIQLRTMSMAAEEEAAAAVASKEANGNNPHGTVVRNSLEKTFVPGWDGYAEQVISEWNEKWRRRDSNTRRARRASARGSVSGRGDSALRHDTDYDPARIPGATAAAGGEVKLTGPSEKGSLNHDSQEDDSQDIECAPKSSKRPKLKREATGTGITAFLSRLLRTETTVVELPTLTINMTTVEEDYDTSQSDYEEDDEYDSDDEQEEEDEEAEASQRRAPMTKNLLHLEIKAPEPLFMKDRNSEPASPSNVTDEHYTSTVNGSLAGDRAVSEADTHDSAIPLQSLFARPSIDTSRRPLTTLDSTDALTPLAIASPQTPTLTTVQTQVIGTTSAATVTTVPQPSIAGSSHVAASAVAAAFYLPLECRQRIHAQVQQEGRTDAPHLFGPAKNFVVDVVLREHYYPLFLEYVKAQNLGLLHESHINNRIKQQGLICLGVALWAVVVAVQFTLVMMAWGGWRSPWVWVAGIIGGYPGSLFLATGLTKFSPILGLVGKIAEDKRVVRFRKTMEPSIVKLHRKKGLWMMFNIVVCSSVVTVAFAALPQRT